MSEEIQPEIAKPAKLKPTHYKTYCFSMYTADAERLDAMVARLKERGWTKASKSHLIRIALSTLDVETMEIPQHETVSATL